MNTRNALCILPWAGFRVRVSLRLEPAELRRIVRENDVAAVMVGGFVEERRRELSGERESDRESEVSFFLSLIHPAAMHGLPTRAAQNPSSRT